MPRFFFDTDDGSTQTTDHYGIDLPSQDAARDLAIKTLPDIAQDAVSTNSQQRMVVRVRDEANHPVLDATLRLDVRWS